MAPSDPAQPAVTTPERVALELPVAGIGSRALAYLVDLMALFAAWVVAYFVLSLAVSDVLGFFQGFSGLAQAVLVVMVFLSQWVYWTACEIAFGGRTLGKRALHIRVASDDGGAPLPLQSAVRNLCRVIDFLPLLYFFGVMSALVSKRSQRLGDLVAGTLLLRDEPLQLQRYDAAPADPSMAMRGPPLTAQQADLVRSFLGRAAGLDDDARARLTAKLVDRFGAHLAAEERARIRRSFAAAEPFLKARAGGHAP